MIGSVPVHVPSLETRQRLAVLGVPEIVGGTVFTGGAGATTSLAADGRRVEPAAFVPVTTTRTRLADVARRRACRSTPVSPAMSAQFEPPVSQRCHW